MKKEYPSLEVINEEIRNTESELEDIKKEMDVNTEQDLYCGTAFVVFNRQSHANRIINLFQVSLVRRAFNFVIYSILR